MTEGVVKLPDMVAKTPIDALRTLEHTAASIASALVSGQAKLLRLARWYDHHHPVLHTESLHNPSPA